MTSIARALPVLVLLTWNCSDRPALPAKSNVTSVAKSKNVPPRPRGRLVAFTFDDLPMSRDGTYGLKRMEDVTAKLLAQLQRADISAVGFVNEIKLTRGDNPAPRIALLDQWVAAGMELGNHTHSHLKFWDTSLAEYERDVLRGERVLRPLLAKRRQRPRYFRHPYLNTGPTPQAKASFERFLSGHGYTIAPVTIDNMDVMYARAYDNSHQAGDERLKQRIANAYLDHMRESFQYFEQLSRNLLGREPAQVLMLHANALNADHLDELITMLRERGYAIIPLESALRDPAYTLPDTYIGPRGPSWLQRWAMSKGFDPGKEPRAPQWIERAAD